MGMDRNGWTDGARLDWQVHVCARFIETNNTFKKSTQTHARFSDQCDATDRSTELSPSRFAISGATA